MAAIDTTAMFHAFSGEAGQQYIGTVINAITDYITVKDGEGRWIAANKTALDLHQIEDIDFIGKSASEIAKLLMPELLLESEKFDEEAWSTGKPIRHEMVYPSPDGSLKVLDFRKIPLFYPNGKRNCLIVIGRDVTQKRTKPTRSIHARKRQLEKSMMDAIKKEQFFLHYQPQIDVSTSYITGVEALLRWRHPRYGIVEPSEFIPIAEETGLIIPIGEYVLRTACLQHVKWLKAGLPPIRVAVNLSALHFQQASVVQLVSDVVYDTGMDPKHLEIEITESAAITNVDVVVKKLHDLRKLGVESALDDFGTGHSSLGRLQLLPVKMLKIERSIIKQLTENESSKPIVQAIISLAHILGMKVTAEGVERKEQLLSLKQLKCDRIQGFFLSRPVSAESLEKDFSSLQQRLLSVM